jgi:hypothetical protein
MLKPFLLWHPLLCVCMWGGEGDGEGTFFCISFSLLYMFRLYLYNVLYVHFILPLAHGLTKRKESGSEEGDR